MIDGMLSQLIDYASGEFYEQTICEIHGGLGYFGQGKNLALVEAQFYSSKMV